MHLTSQVPLVVRFATNSQSMRVLSSRDCKHCLAFFQWCCGYIRFRGWIFHSVKLTWNAPENDGETNRNLQTSRGPPFSGAFAVSFRDGLKKKIIPKLPKKSIRKQSSGIWISQLRKWLLHRCVWNIAMTHVASHQPSVLQQWTNPLMRKWSFKQIHVGSTPRAPFLESASAQSCWMPR